MLPEQNDFDPDHWKVVGAALGHATLAYARDIALAFGKYGGGDPRTGRYVLCRYPFSQPKCRRPLHRETDNWMASSPYASGDLYHLTRGMTYTGMDLASGFLFPFGQMKTAASAGKAILKAEKIAHASPTLLKTRTLASRLFSSHKKVQGMSRGTENINSGIALKAKLSGLQKAQKSTVRIRDLPDGRIRFNFAVPLSAFH